MRERAASSDAELIESAENLRRLGASAVIGVHVNPSQNMTAVENRHGRHRHADGAVGIDGSQVETELQLRRAGLIRRPSQDARPRATLLPGSDNTVKAGPCLSRTDSDPSGACGLIAISRTPRSVSSSSRCCW
jgi:hypothetical protein